MVGSMLASAVGDALGADIEFLGIDTIRRRVGPGGVTGYLGGIGHVTDDTQMLLFTAEALIRSAPDGDPDPTALHHAYLRWLRTQGDTPAVEPPPEAWTGWLVDQPELQVRRAPGTTCLGALRSGSCGTTAAPINGSKGCGGVMRVAPIGLVAGDRAFRLAADAAAVTHGHPTGWLASGALARVVERLVAGVDLAAAIDVALDELAQWEHHHETTTAIHAALRLAATAPTPSPEAVETLGGGWVAEEALAISLYCALTADDLASALLASVNHSGDSDSTGAITGAILGTVTGPGALPADWVANLAERDLVLRVAAELISRCAPRR